MCRAVSVQLLYCSARPADGHTSVSTHLYTVSFIVCVDFSHVMGFKFTDNFDLVGVL